MHTIRRLLPVVTLGLVAAFLYAQAGAPARPAAPQAAGVSAPKGPLLDINTATADQLKALPGIGDAYSKRIIDGRPYTAKNQLAMRGILPQAAYDRIAASIIAHRVAK